VIISHGIDNMEYYMLKHKSGGFMLQRKSEMGYTWSEPEIPTNKTRPPRLFKSELGARKSLGWWEKGPVSNHVKSPQQQSTRDKSEWNIERVRLE